MTDRQRADIGFGEPLETFDPTDWAPTPARRDRPASADTRKAADATGFRSREARAPDPAPPAPAATPAQPERAGDTQPQTQPRRRRTGRNAQFNLKARPDTIARFCAVADAQGWGLGETLEHAVALLEQQQNRINKA